MNLKTIAETTIPCAPCMEWPDSANPSQTYIFYSHLLLSMWWKVDYIHASFLWRTETCQLGHHGDKLALNKVSQDGFSEALDKLVDLPWEMLPNTQYREHSLPEYNGMCAEDDGWQGYSRVSTSGALLLCLCLHWVSCSSWSAFRRLSSNGFHSFSPWHVISHLTRGA